MSHPNDFHWGRDGAGPAGGGGGAGVSVRWLGTAGYELICEGITLLIDPYVTRVPLWRFLLGPIRPDARAVARSISAADAIVVGHSHFDHAVDVPLIAARTGAPVWGSTSMGNLLRAWGLDEAQIVECQGGEVLEVGPFRVELVPSQHSRFALGGRVPYEGDIPCSCELPLRGRDYRCGQVFGIFIQVGGLSIYHCGSANLIDEAVPARASEVDLLVMCLAARHATERFIPRMLARTRPRVLLPSHYDNFFRPTSRRMQLLPLIQFGRFVDEVEQLDRDIRIVTLPFDGVMRLGSG